MKNWKVRKPYSEDCVKRRLPPRENKGERGREKKELEDEVEQRHAQEKTPAENTLGNQRDKKGASLTVPDPQEIAANFQIQWGKGMKH